MTPDDITELFGARCAEFDPDCACCRVWQQQDEIERLQRLVDDNDARSVHTCHDHCQRLECVQRLEIERLRARLDLALDALAQCEDYIAENPPANGYGLLDRDRDRYTRQPLLADARAVLAACERKP